MSIHTLPVQRHAQCPILRSSWFPHICSTGHVTRHCLCCSIYITIYGEPCKDALGCHQEGFKYLNGIWGHLLTIGSGDNDQNGLQGFCDANWASQEHWHSTSGYVFTIDSGTVPWSSKKKQNIIALSTTEAKYIVVWGFCVH